MIYNLLIAIILIVAFFMCVYSYTLGLKHGKTLSSGNIPKLEIPLVQPIKEVIQHFEEKKKEKERQEETESLIRW